MPSGSTRPPGEPEPAAARSEFKVWRRFTTRWADNDAYGHVNNTVFYQWFDSAVNGWLVEQGLLDIQAGDPIALVVETRCSYFAPLDFPQDVEVGLAVAELGRSSVRYRIGVFARRGDSGRGPGRFRPRSCRSRVPAAGGMPGEIGARALESIS